MRVYLEAIEISAIGLSGRVELPYKCHVFNGFVTDLTKSHVNWEGILFSD